MPKGLGFDDALHLLKEGKRLRRSIWKNVKFIFYVAGSRFTVNRAPLDRFFKENTEVEYNPHIDMCSFESTISVWTASTGDILAHDWEIVE